MKLMATWTIRHGNEDRRIELLHGDLALLPPEHAVDVLVVSAFAGDYLTTSGSLIGALGRSGLSVAHLAAHKQIDMREQFSCWLSRPVGRRFNFRRLLCIESGWRGDPPENTDDLFRALAPFLLTGFRECSVAMPLIGAGDQGWPAMDMLEAILRASIRWIERGLKLRLLKIVVLGKDTARDAVKVFASLKQQYQAPPGAASTAYSSAVGSMQHDIFVSYNRAQASMAKFLVSALKASARSPKIYIDLTGISAGTSWPTEIATALDTSRRVVVLYSPDFWASRICQLEFNAAFARQQDTGEAILFPLLLEDVKIPYLFRTIQHIDCRVNDTSRLAYACGQLAASLV